MGLKDDIYKAFEKNLKYIDDNDKEVNPLDESNKGKAKVEELAKDLSKAIVEFIQAQTFTVTKLNATQLGTTTLESKTIPISGLLQPPNAPTVPSTIPPLTIPKITVKVDENNQAVDNQLSGTESLTSEVKLKRAIEV
jgi:hypothetical protein